jgi:hypothetical protein
MAIVAGSLIFRPNRCVRIGRSCGDLFERCCRASCTANNLDPDENVPGKAWGIDDNRVQKRWVWVAQVCGNEISAIIKLAQDEAREMR